MDTKIKIGVIITNDGGDILLIKEKLKKKYLPFWNTVKGTYGDSGDETVFDAAIRECQEETSVKVELTNALGCNISREGEKIRVQFNFLAKIIKGKPKVPEKDDQIKQDESILEVKWFTKDEILKMNKNEFISGLTHKLILSWISGKKFPLEIFKQILAK